MVPCGPPALQIALNGDVLFHHFQVREPEQLWVPILKQNVHSSMLRIAPTLLYGAVHTRKIRLPVTFPHPHPRAPTGFVCLQDVHPSSRLGPEKASGPNRTSGTQPGT